MSRLTNKAITLIGSMSRSEFLKFGRFLASPYFNSNKRLLQIHKILKKHHPNFVSSKFTKEAVTSQLFRKEEFSDTAFRKLFSDLYKLAEKFTVMQSFESKEHDYGKILLEELDKRKLDKLYDAKLQEAVGRIESTGHHYQMFLQLHDLKWQEVSFRLARGEQFKVSPDLYERSEQIIFYFLCDLFITLNDIEMNRQNYNYRHPSRLPQVFMENLNLEAVHEYIARHNFRNKELFLMYYHAFLMNRKSDRTNDFFLLKKLLDSNIEKLSKAGKMNFVLLMINFCNIRLRDSDNEELEKAHMELYELMITHELYKTDNDYIRSDLFLNILNVYLKYRKPERAWNFLNNNSRFANPAHAENLLSLCKAMLLFEEGKYTESLHAAAKVKSGLFIIKMNLRKLLLKVDYELNDFTSNREALGNFRHFVVNSTSMNETNRKRLTEFLNLYNLLIRIKASKEDEHLKALLGRKLENLGRGVDRDWFVSKMARPVQSFGQRNSVSTRHL